MTSQKLYLDYDLWARLIAGMGVIEGHHVLKTDFLSYTPTHVWYDHEYGSGVIFYCFLKYLGSYSLIVLQALLLLGVVYFLIKTIQKRGISSPYNLLYWFIFICIFMNKTCIPIRCQLFSYLCFTLFIYLLENIRQGKYKLSFLLPIITILWNNLHGGVVSGLGLIFLYFVGEITNKKLRKYLLTTLFVSTICLVINPWGIKFISFLIYANTMERPDVVEWLGLFSKIHMLNHIPFKIFMMSIISLEIFVIHKIFKANKSLKMTPVNIDKTKYLVLLVTLYLAISHVKLIPFFIISGTAFCYEDFAKYLETKIPKFINCFCAVIIFLICTTGFVYIINKHVPLGKIIYPHREVEFIKINNIKGNILSNFGYGSFIAYKLYPQNKIYMDGRYEEVYNENLETTMKNFYLLKDNWDEILTKYPTDIILLDNMYNNVYEKMQTQQDWIKVYDTKIFSVFIRKELKKEEYIQPTEDVRYYKNTLFDTSVKF